MRAKNQFKPTEPHRTQGETPRTKRMPNSSTAEQQMASIETAGPKNTETAETLHALHGIHCNVDYATENSTVMKPIIRAIIDQKETNNSQNLQPSLVEPTKKPTPIAIIPPSTTFNS